MLLAVGLGLFTPWGYEFLLGQLGWWWWLDIFVDFLHASHWNCASSWLHVRGYVAWSGVMTFRASVAAPAQLTGNLRGSCWTGFCCFILSFFETLSKNLSPLGLILTTAPGLMNHQISQVREDLLVALGDQRQWTRFAVSLSFTGHIMRTSAPCATPSWPSPQTRQESAFYEGLLIRLEHAMLLCCIIGMSDVQQAVEYLASKT